jgi:Cu2+-exporting ATPase
MPGPAVAQPEWRVSSAAAAAGAGASAAAAIEPAVCFHCATPLPDAGACAADDGRRFCCPGCRAAYDTIVGLGIDAYYRYRTASAPRASTCDAATLALYDDPDVSQTVVTRNAGIAKTQLHLDGIDCPACLWLVDARVGRLPGVTRCRTHPGGESISVEWAEGETHLSEILAGVDALGFTARPFSDAHRRELDGERRHVSAERLLFAVLVGMGVMHFTLAVYLSGEVVAGEPWPLWVRVGHLTSALATAALLAYPGQRFFAGAWREWRMRWPGMNTLVVLGATGAFAGSLVNTLAGEGHVYFDAVAMLIPALLLTQALVHRARERALAPLDRLRRVVPEPYLRRNRDGEARVLAGALLPGDVVCIPPGAVFPADCELDADTAWVDEAVVSGESRAVLRRRGERIMAGAKNGDADVWVKVTHAAVESTVARIERMAEAALAARTPADDFAERLVRGLVPVLLATALVTALVWLAIEPARALEVTLAILVVTCPCALGLAAPTVRMLWFSRALSLGVLPTRLDRMEPLADANVIAFDKTGTLTEGRPQLISVASEGLSRDDGLAIAAALATCSDHPMVRPLRDFKRDGTDAADVSIEAGVGVTARVDGESWFLGKPDAATDLEPADGAAAQTRGDVPGLVELRGSFGQHVHFVVHDALRPEAIEVVAALRGNARLALLSGDRERAVRIAARAAGIDDWHADCSPAQKLAWVRKEQGAGHVVAYVADGVNDLPALGAANVSVSMFGGSTAAQKQADFLLLDGGLAALPGALTLARRARTILRQNLLWAVGYNVVAIPVAAAGFVTPWLAAAGMAASSAIVVANALRLRAATPAEH